MAARRCEKLRFQVVVPYRRYLGRDIMKDMGVRSRRCPVVTGYSGVWSVEIVEELAGQAEANLRQLGCSDVAIRIGDGSRGWREHAPTIEPC